MIHIGLHSFYEQVGEEMSYYRDSGYKIYQECFKHKTKVISKNDPAYTEAVKKYNESKDSFFEYISTNYPLYNTWKYTYQNFEEYKYTAYDDECADLDELEVNKITEDLSSKYNIKKETIDSLDNLGEHIDPLIYLNKYEKSFIYINNIMDRNVKYYLNNYIYKFYSYLSNEALLYNQLVINNRDENLAQVILNEPNKNIYVSYGIGHFVGVFELLKERDKNWRIVESTNKVTLGEAL